MKLRAVGASLLFLCSALFSSAAPLAVGEAAPAVTALTDAGTALNLGDVYAAQRYTLVYFYPKAGTSGCTAQGCSLRDAYEDLTKQGVAVIGVSTDTVEAQHKFKEEQQFPFTLLADTDEKVMNAFGVGKMPVTGWASRSAFLIKDGRIIWADYRASTSRQAADVLRVLANQVD
ncbi:MAG: peroxiredoxin [Cephaloticoccus sp.]